MQRRMAPALLLWYLMLAISWQVSAQEKTARKGSSTIEVMGTGAVRLPAEGARLFVSIRIRMPTLKETAAQEERMVAKLEEAWKQWKTGTLTWRLLDQQMQALRQSDPNLPETDISEMPVVGYAALRLYQLELTGLQGRDLQEAVRNLQKLALEHGATPGFLPRTPSSVVRIIEPDHLAKAREVVYFVRDAEAAYREALKKAQANALAKVQALVGNRSPTQITIEEEMGRNFIDGHVSGITEQLTLEQLGFAGESVGRGSERVSSTPEIEIIARVRVACEF